MRPFLTVLKYCAILCEESQTIKKNFFKSASKLVFSFVQLLLGSAVEYSSWDYFIMLNRQEEMRIMG